MSGSGFKMGLAIATYEWMAALTLVLVAVFFMPVYLSNGILTMPQFLEKRYNSTIALIMAIFWVFLYIVINLTTILYLGALAINSISGLSITLCMILLAIFALFITLGGMKVIGYTDVIQVFFLVLGGLVATYIALNLVAEKSGQTGILNGFKQLTTQANDHFHMIFKKDNENYMDLPGLTVLLGGLWIANLNYWGCNQYITQRALGASLPTARKGILFAAFLKLLMPVIVVLPGIAAYVLRNGFALNIEIKPTPGVEEHTGRVVAEHAQRLWAGAAVPPLLSSFRPEALAGARATAPELPRALLVDALWDGWFEVAQQLGCVAVVSNHKLMDAALIAQLHGHGLRALVYTVNEPDDVQRLMSLGIDGIITDAVDRFSPASA